MTVSRGREFLSIPGPTNIPDAVLAAMHRPAIDIYAGDMLAVTHSLLEDLPKIFRTRGRTYIYAANGHGGWEAALTNVLSRGETVLVLESGLFALGWGDMARMMGVKVEVLKGDPRRAVDPVALAQRLAADSAREIKAILVVQIDTASGVVNDLAAIHRAIASVGHPALLMVDCVASLGCMPFAMDEWGIDVAMAGSQKGLMTPPRSRVRRRQRARTRRASARGPAHALLGLDVPQRRSALPAVRRHAAAAPALRLAQGARYALRGRPRRGDPPPRAARGGDAPRREPVGGGGRGRVQHRPPRGARQLGDHGERPGPRAERAQRLLSREVRRRPRPRDW